MPRKREGRLDIITGPMFSGKSEELVKRLRRFKVAGLTVKVFNHTIDVRYGKNRISSHSKDHWKAIPVSNASEILSRVSTRTDVVIIDEANFFDNSLIKVIDQIISKDVIVIAAGLDTDFRGKPFGVLPDLLAIADGEVLKLKAVCSVCKKWNATRSQRLTLDGKPVPFNQPLIAVGSTDIYQARCRKHHEVPREQAS